MGTRPEIVGVSRLLVALKRSAVTHSLVVSPQDMGCEESKDFLRALGITNSLEITRSYRESGTVPRIKGSMTEVEGRITRLRPTLVVVHGNSSASLGATIVASSYGIPVVQLEAGMRSGGYRAPGENTGRIIDNASSLLFAPTHHAAENLIGESVWGKVSVAGSTVIDAVEYYANTPDASFVKGDPSGDYLLATFHRPENIDDPSFLRGLVSVLYRSPTSVVMQLGSRLRLRLSQYGLLEQVLGCGNLTVVPLLHYSRFLSLMKRCQLIVTDSGALEEEATSPSIRKRVIVTRYATERPEAQIAGFTSLAGTDPQRILKEISRLTGLPRVDKDSPFGDGHASERITEEIQTYHSSLNTHPR